MRSLAFAHDTGLDRGVYDNVLDDESDGTQYIGNVNDLEKCEITICWPYIFCFVSEICLQIYCFIAMPMNNLVA